MSRPTLVFRNGRAIDPETGFDSTADVAISGGRITAVGDVRTPAQIEFDVTGHVITSGFIDLHSHTTGLPGLRLRTLDGVTTALDLEAGASPVEEAYHAVARDGSPVNYGFSASWALARMAALGTIARKGSYAALMRTVAEPSWQCPASPTELTAILASLTDDIVSGALGIGILLGYAPNVEPEEIRRVASLAAESGVPAFVHARDITEINPGTTIDGAREIIKLASETGAHMHYCHINSTSLRHVGRVLAEVHAAQLSGSRISVESYPYGSGATSIGAAFLAPDLLPIYGLKPQDLLYAPTGEAVPSVTRLRELRDADPSALVIIRHLGERRLSDLEILLQPFLLRDTVVASDAMPLTWHGPAPNHEIWPLPAATVTHPRTAGTYARALRLLARETAAGPPRLGLIETLRRSSFLPARLLEGFVPAMRRKGRLRPGADADIVVFDPKAVTDQSSYKHSTRPSTGFKHVLVNGVLVVRDSHPVLTARPGLAIRGQAR